MTTILVQESSSFYNCYNCHYNTCRKSQYDRHLMTSKHVKNVEILQNTTILVQKVPEFICNNCNNKYKHHSSLYNHKKKCIIDKQHTNEDKINTNEISPELIMSVLQQNKELQTILLEQNKTIIELSKNNSITNNNNITHTNSHNKAFNLNFFLNETCKNAMNITDFVDSIKLQLSDLENVGRIGYVEGLSKIIIKNLKALDVTERPVHCSDSKRDTMYVKDEDKWEKESENNERVLKAIEDIANKNSKMVKEWKQKNPECASSKSHKADVYSHIMIQAVCSNNDANNNKILKKIAKEITIDKS
uniref:C2H2-type domain-containing protein n=1 Tax=viral metagenome TaxID=1070528 RepID=A0A6C0IJP9_9ZZZZ